MLGDSVVGRDVLELCDQHGAARKLLLEDRSKGLSVIAFVGATGQGKSWIMRSMVHSAEAAKQIQSGDNLDEATEQLVWTGPFPPADMDHRYERYVNCPSSDMQSISAPYLLVDAPGNTDDRPMIAEAASRALSLASILVLVVRRDQLRSHTVGLTTQLSEGCTVIPVINAVRQQDGLQSDIDAFVAHLRRSAPRSIIAPAVIVDDFDVEGRSESETQAEASQRLAQAIQRQWESSGGDRRILTRLAALDERFHAALHQTLAQALPDLTTAVNRMKTASDELPGEIASSLLGNQDALQAVVRSRLRLHLLTETAPFWFPYRTFLGTLNLTHGAWDRLLFSMSGSLPSLVGTIWSSAKNLTETPQQSTSGLSALQRRCDALLRDRFGPLTSEFHRQIQALGQTDGETTFRDRSEILSDTEMPLRMTGLDSLQQRSQEIFGEEVRESALGSFAVRGFAVLATAVFAALVAGPIVALYRSYFDASLTTLRHASGDLSAFPKAEASLLFTGLFLSVLPVLVLAMVAMTMAQSRQRVLKASTRIDQKHKEAIATLQKSGVLKLA
ncbi:MAG: hypothetical protein AAF664_09975, partial [Planctomycetota bacterium]